MTPADALAHFAAKLPTNIDRQSPEEAVDREAVEALTAALADFLPLSTTTRTIPGEGR